MNVTEKIIASLIIIGWAIGSYILIIGAMYGTILKYNLNFLHCQIFGGCFTVLLYGLPLIAIWMGWFKQK